VLIEYVSADNRLLAITVTHDRITVTPLPNAGNAVDLSKRVDFFASLVQENDEASLAPAARRLYADLLEPALVGVPDSAHTLIIAADGPLHRLPFDALGAPTPVIERWDVITVPSASILARAAQRDRPNGAALVVTAPATSARLSLLPAAPEEAAVIRRRMRGEISELSGATATKEKLQAEDLQRFAVLHFASHAVVDEERPLRSSLMLALEPSGIEGRWTAEEIYRTKLKADLVVLSACSTAAGAQSAGEGVMSLSRAFLYAGAGATIATLWDVPDAPGPVFADVLYRELAGGTPLGESVADARRELRRQGAPPRAWAAYTVTGNPSARIGIEPQSTDNLRTAGMTGAVALILLVAFVAFRALRAKRVHAGR
jgi:CHAT domain-containing protein